MRPLVLVLVTAVAVHLMAGCGRKGTRGVEQGAGDGAASALRKTTGSVGQGNAVTTREESERNTNLMANVISRLLEEPRKEPPTNRIRQTIPESRIVSDPRERVKEAMELMVKNADRELTLLTRERHETELRLRESDPLIRGAFNSFIQSRDTYYSALGGNPEYQKALKKEAEAYSTLTNAMARLEAFKQESKRR
ncbi:MAG: hypothetical protein ACUVWX_00020 [Kiritimatiellia bacterium]